MILDDILKSGLKMYKYPSKKFIIDEFNNSCKALDILELKEHLKDLIIYEMTDGTRTSTDLNGDEGYVDGGIFCLRFIHIFRILGGQNLYVNVIHEGHKNRENYLDIFIGLVRLADIYKEFACKYKIRLKFIGNYSEKIDPKGYQDNFINQLKEIEDLTKDYTGLTVHFLINYSTRWAATKAGYLYDKLPEANVIVRHAKGYVNGDMWLYGKLDRNSFVYVQNGSSSLNWSDRQLIYLITLSFRSMLLNMGTHLSKSYKDGEKANIRKQREIDLSIVQKSFYDTNKETKMAKRAVIFSSVGPEIYKF